MTRPLRIEFHGAWYHVMNRGRRGENIFCNTDDYGRFIALLQEAGEMFTLRVSAFCLMPNHYHILLQTPQANLSRAMRHINGVYTQRFNRARKIDGQVFRGRYKSVLVQEDSHLLELLRYIHKNPLQGELCSNMENYLWSSHHAYISSTPDWNWIHKKFLLDMFDQNENKARKQYKKFVRGENSTKVIDFFGKKKLGSVFGSENFIQSIKATFQHLQNPKEIPESKCFAPTIVDIKTALCRYYSIDSEILMQSKRGQINEPRNIAVYLTRKWSGLCLEEIGQEFEIANYSSVSSIVTRFKKQLLNNRELQNKIEAISQLLHKSHAKT